MPTPTRTLLQNFYGVSGPCPNDYPKVAARVSPDDYAFLNTLFPNLHRKYDVIISTLYARFITHLRTTLADGGTGPAVLDIDDPRYSTLFACLFDELPGCPARRDFLLARQEETTRNDGAGVSRLREASLVLEGLFTNPSESHASGGGNGQGEEGEKGLSQPSGSVAEGVVVDLDEETNSILKLLRS